LPLAYVERRVGPFGLKGSVLICEAVNSPGLTVPDTLACQAAARPTPD